MLLIIGKKELLLWCLVVQNICKYVFAPAHSVLQSQSNHHVLCLYSNEQLLNADYLLMNIQWGLVRLSLPFPQTIHDPAACFFINNLYFSVSWSDKIQNLLFLALETFGLITLLNTLTK